MRTNRQSSYPFGPGSLLAIVLLSMIALLSSTVIYLSFKYLSLNKYNRIDTATPAKGYPPVSDFETYQTSPKVSWPQYKNDQYGFTFSYPQDWRITKDLFSENFILVATNQTVSSETSAEIRIEASSLEMFESGSAAEDNSSENEMVYGYENTFSRSLALAGEEKKTTVRFHYLEVKANGEKIPKDNWKYYDIYEKMIQSFSFGNNE